MKSKYFAFSALIMMFILQACVGKTGGNQSSASKKSEENPSHQDPQQQQLKPSPLQAQPSWARGPTTGAIGVAIVDRCKRS